MNFNEYAEKSLVQFLSEEDHINSIRNYLIEKLEELYQIKIDNPNLKWI